ncbi:MAG TPA: SAM-dependent methyltransferase [Cyclobacteriaceae bacterium]
MKSLNQTKGKLLLIPNLISETKSQIELEVVSAIQNTKYFLAETPKIARRFIKNIDSNIHLESLSINPYDKNTSMEELELLLQPLKQGFDVGIITDSGMPGIADPGSSAVLIAHKWGVQVKPFVGASSIFLALSASGLPGQQFSFHGYLPVSEKECTSTIKKLELESSKRNSSQIFIETPYRNKRLFNLLLKTLMGDTKLCIAMDITGIEERIMTQTVSKWNRQSFEFKKLPCVFIIYSGT